jgi:hypothetical protein
LNAAVRERIELTRKGARHSCRFNAKQAGGSRKQRSQE